MKLKYFKIKFTAFIYLILKNLYNIDMKYKCKKNGIGTIGRRAKMKMRRLAAICLVAAMTVSVVGCGASKNKGESEAGTTSAEKEAAGSTSAEGAGGTSGDAVKVGVIFGTGGLGDKNFNDMTYAGVTRAQEELGIKFDYVEPNSISDFVPFGRQFAETGEYDLLIAVGADQEEAMQEIAEEFPDQKISILDSAAKIDGVSTIQTEWSEQTFLAGVIAGLGTLSEMEKANKDNVIGVILGDDLPNLREGVVGFTAGAKYVNPDVQVLEGVVGAFNDPGKGKEIGLSMYNKGADFIQCIAGASGLGVFGAAKEADRYAFGVGSNQNLEDPDHVVASSVRSVDWMVYNEIEKVIYGNWEPGLHMSGIKESAVGYDTEGSNVELPEEIKATVEDIREMLVAEKLTPCKTADELDTWVAKNQYTK